MIVVGIYFTVIFNFSLTKHIFDVIFFDIIFQIEFSCLFIFWIQRIFQCTFDSFVIKFTGKSIILDFQNTLTMFLTIFKCTFINWKRRHNFKSSFTIENIIIEIAKINTISTVISVFTTHFSSTTNNITTVAATVFILDLMHVKTLKEVIIFKNSIIYSIIIYLMNFAIAFKFLKFIARYPMLLPIFKNG